MDRKSVDIDEVIATFSSHISKNYPSAKHFRRNFKLLLKGKRNRSDESGYAISLEKNIVFLDDLVAGAEALMEKLLATGSDSETGEHVSAALAALEKRAHGQTAEKHRDAFIEGKTPEFQELWKERQAWGGGYLEKLEFHYRYLMTFRIFLFEFISLLAAIRQQYSISRGRPGALQKVRNSIELTVHYYLGNVAVGEEDAERSGKAPSN